MEYQPIRVVHSEQLDSATAQTPGSQRFAAIHSGVGIESPMWGGLFLVDPGASTGIHHHGEQHTIAYVLNGSSYVRWGSEVSLTLRCKQGIFFMSRRGFRTRRLILPPTSPSNGLLSAALPNPLL